MITNPLENFAEFQKEFGKDKVIHRSMYEIITSASVHHRLKREQEINKNKGKGWGSPEDKPYEPLGKFNNVLEAFQMCKGSIPHTKEIRVDTLKAINYMKNSNNPILKGKPLKRINEMLNDGKPTFEMHKSVDRARTKKLYGINVGNAEHDGSFISDNRLKNVDNKKLKTPYFVLISNVKDGSNILREQINQSAERMKAARHGHSIESIYREYDHSFYLPDKNSYITKTEAKIRRMDSGSSANTSFDMRNKSKIFQTEVDYENASTIRINKTKRSNTSMNISHKKTHSLITNSAKFRELK